ncbi:L-aspartate oxidase [Arcobacter sp. FWKO B]|uniref:L-aspartate oxidase n=1 Tax=Arcobacter sp. FWKO B TaxID=2593672 RepID=UPI0018A5DDF3|nr:FAD-dependent oxidoreductase [Arcobacter sp. FWKO B]QOG12227.1 FAD-binding protein [Arcobacter sp. FWKO B]
MKKYDVLIIGSGVAGLSAAIEVKSNGANVLVVTKNVPTACGSAQAQGGINFAISNDDSIQAHIEDTLKSSCGLGSIKHITKLCENSKKSLEWLNDIGVVFSKNDDTTFSQRRLGGSSHKRACYASDYTGLKIVQTLYDKALNIGVEFLSDGLLLNLIVEDDICYGATVLDIKTTLVKEIYSKSTILATGGYSAIYEGFTTNSYAVSGDGIAAAYRAGCKLSNMEFVQFHPTALKEKNILISESARAEGGYLLDAKEKRFVDELEKRDVVARAVFEKLKDGDVYIDLRHLGSSKINELLPQEVAIARNFANLDITKELVPINPAAHYSMGGIKVNENTQTNINNLFACGECADTQIHGANRLGGNSLLEAVVFGRVAGFESAINACKNNAYIKENSKQYQNDSAFINGVFNFSNQIDFYEKRSFMGKIFYKNIGLFRTDLNMKAVLSQIRQWQKEFNFMGISDKSTTYNTNLVDFIEFGNMLEISEIIAVSAISRCESRGSHFRIDYPQINPSFEKISVAYKIDGILAVDFEDLK